MARAVVLKLFLPVFTLETQKIETYHWFCLTLASEEKCGTIESSSETAIALSLKTRLVMFTQRLFPQANLKNACLVSVSLNVPRKLAKRKGKLTHC